MPGLLEITQGIKAVTLELTNRCNLQCQICNIWREAKKFDLSCEEIARLLESIPGPLSVALTGGEPFLHPRFKEILKYLFRLSLIKKINDINIATNGYSAAIPDFLAQNHRFLAPFSFSISLDGLKNTHDLQRGKKNSFSMTLKNILAIRRYNYPIGIKFVITKLNYQDFKKVHELSQRLGCSFYPKFFEKLDHYYHRAKGFARLSAPENIIKKLLPQIQAIEKLEAAKNNNSLSYYALRSLRRFAQNNSDTFIKKCLTPSNSLFLSCRGDLYSCLYQDKITTLKEWPKLNTALLIKLRQNASRGKCPRCISYHGFLREFNFR